MVTSTEYLPVAYLPGASGRASVWEPVAQRLARRRVPILVDYPGLSDLPLEAGIDSLSALSDWVLGRLPDRFDLVALSMGGAVALRIALEQPERVRKMVLVTTAGGVDARRFGGVDWRPGFLVRQPAAPRWFVDDTEDLTSRLRELRAPVQLVFGERDLVAPPAVGQFLLNHLPAARLEVVAGATHDLEAEEPDLLASLIEAHLRR
jgi:pimeloyl-ACP methyl ester carboxylesterase